MVRRVIRLLLLITPLPSVTTEPGLTRENKTLANLTCSPVSKDRSPHLAAVTVHQSRWSPVEPSVVTTSNYLSSDVRKTRSILSLFLDLGCLRRTGHRRCRPAHQLEVPAPSPVDQRCQPGHQPEVPTAVSVSRRYGGGPPVSSPREQAARVSRY